MEIYLHLSSSSFPVAYISHTGNSYPDPVLKQPAPSQPSKSECWRWPKSLPAILRPMRSAAFTHASSIKKARSKTPSLLTWTWTMLPGFASRILAKNPGRASSRIPSMNSETIFSWRCAAYSATVSETRPAACAAASSCLPVALPLERTTLLMFVSFISVVGLTFTTDRHPSLCVSTLLPFGASALTRIGLLFPHLFATTTKGHARYWCATVANGVRWRCAACSVTSPSYLANTANS